MKTELPWACEITKGLNGYNLIFTEVLDDGTIRNNLQVFEEPDTETGDLKAMQGLLYAVIEYFGVYSSKHNEYNLVVEIRKENEDA